MEFRAASRLPQAPAREGRKPVVCRTHNIWEPLPRLPENPGKPRTRGSGVLSLSAYATIWHRPLVPAILRSDHDRIVALGQRYGLLSRGWQIENQTRRAQPARRRADQTGVERPAGAELAVRLYPVRHCARQPRLRLADVGTGDLTDIEAVARGIELAPQHLLVVDVEVDHGLIADHVQICRGAVQQDCLFGRQQIGALRLNQRFRLLCPGLGATARVERLNDVEIDGARLNSVLLFASPGPLPRCRGKS